MNKVLLTDVVISKGFDGKAALRFNSNKSAVNFKIGKRVYDKNAPDNHRYMNIAVKGYSKLIERIEKMQLKEGSRINIVGQLDEENWEDNGQKFNRIVIIAEEIEYASSDGSKSNGTNGAGSASPSQKGNGTAAQTSTSAEQSQNASKKQTDMPEKFSGYTNFDMNDSSDNDFFN